jgi:HTH-type transcriptional regulator/antitoxin HipB
MVFKRNLKRRQREKLPWQKNSKDNTSMKKQKNNLTSFADHLDSQYGKRGSSSREKYEQEFEAFRLGVVLQELRKEKGLTQEQLAERCGTTKNYISRIENNASDIRLSTLMRIIREGLGGHLKFTVDF